MLQVLFSWLVVGELRAREELVGLAQLALVVPALLFVVLGGAVADRLDRRHLLVGLHIAAGGLAVATVMKLAYETFTESPLGAAGWHLMGTARMGRDPATSVVNEWGRCHDVRNLFVVDGSVFVTSGAVNPTCTIQGFALYVADRVKKNLANLFDA